MRVRAEDVQVKTELASLQFACITFLSRSLECVYDPSAAEVKRCHKKSATDE